MTSSASTPASSINPPPPTLSPCPEGYISWYLNCYKLVEVPATWDAAQMSCEHDGKCLPFWILYGRYCYYVYNGQKGFSWPDSRHYCQTVKADLASLHSRAEVEFIRNLNYTKYHNVDVFLFLFQLYLGWGWTDGTALGFLNWSPGEPNTAFHPGEVGEESCVEMYPDGRWNDNNCLQKRGFACRQCKDLILEYRTSGSFQAAFILFF
uniref:C-type lectin domain-containing protein n=1 Tax=Cyclopterus lumpus TaxID=8103 RepID=A0A8C2WNX0_CYCLU